MKTSVINVKNVLLSIGVLSMMFYAADIALAASGFNNPLGTGVTTVSGLLTKIIKWILGISAFLAMLALVVGGVRLIISFGNPSGVSAAKNNILWAVIGIAVIMLSYAIITLVSDLLGVS